jgi:zinc/manganese transport system ATP-binding protein
LASLDLRSQHEIVTLLKGLHRDLSVTVVVVAHDLNPFLPILDGAIYLLDGHAHYAGVNDVIEDELLTHLYGTPIQVVRTPQGDLYARSV